MRKNRLYGVAFAVLLGTGLASHRPGAPHHAGGVTRRPGIRLASVDVPAAAPSTTPDPLVGSTGFVVLRPPAPRAVEAQWSWKAALEATLAPPPPPPPPPVPAAVTPAPTPATLAAVTKPATHSAPAPVIAATIQPGAAATSPAGGVWAGLRQCESHGNYRDDTGNGYYGAYQFSLATWRGLGLGGLPSAATPAVQDLAASRLQARSGWGQWPVCARRLHLL